MKDLLCKLSFYEVWLFQEVDHCKICLSLVKQRIKDNYIQNWNGESSNMSRGHVYNPISCFQYQPYLDILTIDKFRISLTKIRVSSHRLTIETGRWENPNVIPYNERLCKECNTVEDVYHCVCECSLYVDLRCKYIPAFYRLRPNMFKFIELLRTVNTYTLTRLSTFIFKAFEIRNAYNYT